MLRTALRCATLILPTALLFGCADQPTTAPAARLVARSADARVGGGNVLPATAKPGGYTLTDMAQAMAYFTTSGNDLAYYPQTRFQILYVDRKTGTNSFTVSPGTKFFIPVAYADDSPPILGDFPTSAAAAGDYFFSPEQLGGHDLEIEVDGEVTRMGPAYVAGPVNAPGLLDGGGSHFTQLGAFLTPLPPGTHEVTIRGTFDGAALAPYGGGFSFEATYTVIVR